MKMTLVKLTFCVTLFLGFVASSALASAGPMPDPSGPFIVSQATN